MLSLDLANVSCLAELDLSALLRFPILAIDLRSGFSVVIPLLAQFLLISAFKVALKVLTLIFEGGGVGEAVPSISPCWNLRYEIILCLIKNAAVIVNTQQV